MVGAWHTVSSPSILAVVITAVNTVAVPTFLRACFGDTVSRGTSTHWMDFALSVQLFRDSRSELRGHGGGRSY